MAGRWTRAGCLVLLFSSALLLGCGTGPTAEPEPTPTPGVRFLMPTPGTPPAPPVRSPTPEMISYIVREGDTLYGIALRYEVDMETLIEINGLSDPNALSLGQELKIPVEREPTATPSP